MHPTPDTIEPFDRKHKQWRIIIETPKGSHNKYKYDPKQSCFELAKVLPEGMMFPYDFGFVPSTEGDDGDPLDVLLLMDQPTFCGCLIPCRLIGVIEARQTEKDGHSERNDRLVAVAVHTRTFGDLHSVNSVDQQMLHEIEQFFVTYNQEAGKKFKLLGLRGPNRAKALVKQGMKQFARSHKGSGAGRQKKK